MTGRTKVNVGDATNPRVIDGQCQSGESTEALNQLQVDHPLLFVIFIPPPLRRCQRRPVTHFSSRRRVTKLIFLGLRIFL